jgi:leucyl-tRNA---protein transferase
MVNALLISTKSQHILTESDACRFARRIGQQRGFGHVTVQFRLPRFYVTSPSPCPYLPEKMERKVFTELSGNHADELHDALSKIGFRRSQGVAYRPSCLDCSACVSVRVLARKFVPNATQRKLIKRNSDLVVTPCRAWATNEQFALLREYLAARHPSGGMSGMDEIDFADMVEHSPVNTQMMEYREPGVDGKPGRLVGACLTDVQADGLSMIYSFFDAASQDRPGLGNYIILDHIRMAVAMGLEHVYLGYWIKGSKRMAYKARFQPMEKLGPNGWSRFSEEQSSCGALLNRLAVELV